ncbi:unnamed protein product [Pleuronectes platessa]|uniref:Uncharacterized protein n=1 Tax=Pleuronectes platessa TaxID=8262 RepID=A0A9N7V5V6_PLEPL|nr:unnamed protein product [Pleuronectes platessa]
MALRQQDAVRGLRVCTCGTARGGGSGGGRVTGRTGEREQRPQSYGVSVLPKKSKNPIQGGLTGRPIPTDPAPSFPELPLRISTVYSPSAFRWGGRGRRVRNPKTRTPRREAQKTPSAGPGSPKAVFPAFGEETQFSGYLELRLDFLPSHSPRAKNQCLGSVKRWVSLACVGPTNTTLCALVRPLPSAAGCHPFLPLFFPAGGGAKLKADPQREFRGCLFRLLRENCSPVPDTIFAATGSEILPQLAGLLTSSPEHHSSGDYFR